MSADDDHDDQTTPLGRAIVAGLEEFRDALAAGANIEEAFAVRDVARSPTVPCRADEASGCESCGRGGASDVGGLCLCRACAAGPPGRDDR